MPDDAPVPPLAPIGAEPVAPTSRPPVVPGARRIGSTPPTQSPSDELLGDATARAQLLAPRPGGGSGAPQIGSLPAPASATVSAPPSTASALAAAQVTADVHDAAVHGTALAGAIERARARGRSERSEALAGGAASAGSGQAARIRVDPAPVEGEHDDIDPLAAIQPIESEARGSHARREREEREAERHEDDLVRARGGSDVEGG